MANHNFCDKCGQHFAVHNDDGSCVVDETEGKRREMLREINVEPGSREDLELKYGQVWDTQQLTADFTAEGFMAPYVVATRKSDGVKGSLMFQDSPRFYWGFNPA